MEHLRGDDRRFDKTVLERWHNEVKRFVGLILLATLCTILETVPGHDDVQHIFFVLEMMFTTVFTVPLIARCRSCLCGRTAYHLKHYIT